MIIRITKTLVKNYNYIPNPHGHKEGDNECKNGNKNKNKVENKNSVIHSGANERPALGEFISVGIVEGRVEVWVKNIMQLLGIADVQFHSEKRIGEKILVGSAAFTQSLC